MAKREPRQALNSLRTQLLVYTILLILVPLAFMFFFSNHYSAQALDEQATGYTTQMLKQVQTNVDANVHTIDQIIRYLADDPDVLEFLRLADFYSPNRLWCETNARQKMTKYVQANPELIGGILIANAHDLYASSELYRIARTPLIQDAWYQQAVATDGERLLISKPIGRNIRNYRNYSTNDIVSAVCAVKDPEDGAVLGVICVDMQLKVIENHIRDLTLGKSGYIFVMDERGQIVYTPVNPTVYRIRSEWVSGNLSLDANLHTINNERYQLMGEHSGLTNWRMVGAFKSGEALEPVLALRRSTLMVLLAALTVASVTALTFSASFTYPISLLRKAMYEAETGNLNVSFATARYHGEIAQLGTSFNKMMDKVRTLLQLIYVEQKNKREADIKTLQAQIKPHFLYNTLDTIRWMAQERGAAEIVKMIAALTKLFRIALSRGRDVISLADELEHVQSYLYIQQVRYEEKLAYSFDVDPQCRPYQVNKLILQPLVENAIYHGIKQKRGEGHIAIIVRKEEDRLVICVQDDGVGVSPEKCDAINAELRLFAPLFSVENATVELKDDNFDEMLNPDSRTAYANAKLEPSLANAAAGERFQFVRTGYFTLDSKDDGVFNRIAPLKSGWKPIG